MAARFPQSTTSVAYQIKAAWSSKIHVLYWAADADKMHRLRSGDTSTTILTRSASGCTFDSTNGVIAGNNSTRFTDSIAGGYGALQENSNFTFGGCWYGDFFNGGITSSTVLISSNSSYPPSGSFYLAGNGYEPKWSLHNGDSNTAPGTPVSDNVIGYMTLAVRHDQADATADLRTWCNGSEFDTKRVTSVSPTSTSLLGDTGRDLYIGDSKTGTGNTKAHFEFALLAGVLSDAEMATITSDPASVIEVASSPTRLAIPTSQLTLPRSALAASSSHSFRRFG